MQIAASRLQDFGGRHHRGGSKRGSGGSLERGAVVSHDPGACAGAEGPRQTFRVAPRLPNTRVQDVRDAEGGFLDGGGVQREGAAARAGRGAIGGRPQAEVGRVEGSQPGGEHSGGCREVAAARFG